MSSCIPPVKAYLVDTALPGLFPLPALVSYGMPGSFTPMDIVSVGNARAQSHGAALTASRPQEETVELDVLISCFRPGGPQVQRDATEAAFSMVSALREYLKVRGNETLGGSCRTATVTDYELTEDGDPNDITKGRLSQVLVTLTVRARN